MKKHLLPALVAIAGLGGLQAFAADADPVLMTIDGHDIRVSEFEYLYNKNNNQQLQQQSIDDYLKLFIDYKLKVADAEHAGLEDTPEFKAEYLKFRNDLAKPYLRDASVEEALVQEAYNHHSTDVMVSHIMMPLTPASAQTLDSLRNEIRNGRTSFEDAARRFSVDRGSSAKGGLMGYVVPERFPWPFEKVAYETAQGEISPVVNSGVGYHLIRVESVAPAQGEVLAEHILLLTRNVSPEQAASAKTRIDSLYQVAKSGADFADLARRFSQDPGSAKEGGRLPWFTRGMMVAAFDSTAFAMPDGSISEPIETPYGWHIIHRLDHRTAAPLEDARKNILQKMQQDERANEPERAFLAAVVEKNKGGLNQKGLQEALALSANRLDSASIAALSQSQIVVANLGSDKITMADAALKLQSVPGTVAQKIEGAAKATLESRARQLAVNELLASNADFRNLANEYRDGILLYEISNRNVWDRAAKDTEGLEAYFHSHADRYAWKEPKFKSFIFFANNDSILNEAVNYANTLDSSKPAQFTQDLRKKFGRDLKVERVIAARGENPITDYLGFGGDKPAADAKSKWSNYVAYKGRVISAPEEAADVRGAAVTDYQNELEREWVESLHKKYKVKVNNKVFKKLSEKK